MPFWLARSTANWCMRPTRPQSWTSFREVTCFFGMTRTCTGACGSMSGKASSSSVSATFCTGILPAAILQKMQSSMGLLEHFLRVEQQRHRPLVDEAHLHGGAEDAFRHLD